MEDAAMKIIVIGHTQAGKSTAAAIIAELTGGKAMDTFDIIAEVTANLDGVHVEAVHRMKNHMRPRLRTIGDHLCREDPAALVKSCWDRGATVVAGCRRREEVDAAKALGATVLWVHRPGVTGGSTDGAGIDQADYVLNNTGTMADLRGEIAYYLPANGALR